MISNKVIVAMLAMNVVVMLLVAAIAYRTLESISEIPNIIQRSLPVGSEGPDLSESSLPSVDSEESGKPKLNGSAEAKLNPTQLPTMEQVNLEEESKESPANGQSSRLLPGAYEWSKIIVVYVLNKDVTIGFRRSSEGSGSSCCDQDEQVLFDLTDPNHQENLMVLMRNYGIGDNLSHVHLLLGKDVIVKSEERREPDGDRYIERTLIAPFSVTP